MDSIRSTSRLVATAILASVALAASTAGVSSDLRVRRSTRYVPSCACEVDTSRAGELGKLVLERLLNATDSRAAALRNALY